LADAELLGMPFVAVIGRRLADGLVELRTRRDGGAAEVALTEISSLISG